MKILHKCRVRMFGGTHFFQINGVWSVIKIVSSRRAIRSNFCTLDPQILGAAVQYVVPGRVGSWGLYTLARTSKFVVLS
jgi:hypothetical protein